MDAFLQAATKPLSLFREINQVELREPQQWTAIRNGEENVFEQVFREHYPALCAYARSYLDDMDEAEEVVQHMFLLIWEKRSSLDVISSLKAYLFRAVQNHCLNKLKHRKIRQVHAEETIRHYTEGEESTLKQINGRELEKKIAAALEELPGQCGEVFRLSRIEQLSYKEIAQQLGISVKTVENHMGKALKLMRNKLKDYLPAILAWMMIHIHHN